MSAVHLKVIIIVQSLFESTQLVSKVGY